MACITKQRVGKYTYLYESVSFRDDIGRPRNKKTRIGKIDPVSGKAVYTREYLERMSQAGTPVPVTKPKPLLSDKNYHELALEILSSIRSFGAYYLLSNIAQNIGLLPVLEQSIPDLWLPIFNLACFMVATGDPLMYCDDWLRQTTADTGNSLTSQRISELFDHIHEDDRSRFYSHWMHHVQEIDFIALDITSISSYSELMMLAEWGYNRDHENLAQVNMCMLLGETTLLPIYQTIYQGSLKDVSTLQTTLRTVTCLCPGIAPKIVMDKGFYSTRNINAMWDSEREQWNFSFLMAVPFTSGYARKVVESERKDIDTIGNTILTSEGAIRGVHKLRKWTGIGQKLHTFIYFNPTKALKDRNELFAYVTQLKQRAEENPADKALQREFARYLIIRRSSLNDKGYTVSLRNGIIEKQLETAGWLVLVSDHLEDAQQAINVYRSKDFVEKGFGRLKNFFDLNRLRVHQDERTQNKIFCGFIALILASAIDKTMKEKDLYKSYTMKELLRKVARIHQATVGSEKILQPLTKEQTNLFKAFNIPLPVG